ncbi:hypothetical protein HPP92_007995 [Vanilla planifolia]|uniref:Uncharacterized protein n=1 Tax=Vanilla planifolia TaxID=51239 RepID=A0A835RDM8_VANPL|nr:hypothetical protein HPP92_007995 [Vanilla planifolia]
MNPSKVDAYDQAPPTSAGFPLNQTNKFYPPSESAPSFRLRSDQPLIAWSTGLCNCCDDKSICCLTCCCPCITFGKIAGIVDRGSSSCGTSSALYALICVMTGGHCIYSCFYRSKMRAQYSLREAPCTDCIVHCCCEPCALCQEYRELKRRGFNMRIGWQANMERQGIVTTTVPPSIEGDMSR